MGADFWIAAIITVVGISTPILLAGLGELVVEKAGVLNLGVEGMMLLGAIGGFAGAVLAPQFGLGAVAPWIGVLCGAVAGTLGALLFGFFALTLSANQVATGLALTIFGTGLSSLIGTAFVGRIVAPFGSIFPPELARDPLLKVFFGYSPVVYFAVIMVFVVAWFLKSTRSGLILRAVGENDLSAHSIGYSVIGVRYAAVAFGGAMAGIGGAYFSLVITPMWAERMTAGRGWIALALVVFASWRAGRLLWGAVFFGMLVYLELFAKASGFSVLPSQFWAAMPYLMTVVVLALISMRDRVGLNAPACLGKPFVPQPS
jgi:simple sugar transport system permease protein